MFDVLLQVLLRDVGVGKSSLVLPFVKGQFVEFQGRMDKGREREDWGAFFGVNGLPHRVGEQRMSGGGMGEERVFSFVI
ncbi:hypothetical protein C1H46_031207 [Malus baccata]|uniref:Uncharacterized protein n=1 Tax=Malus baccata TaxID=106549 RepID=A0A540L9T3_MALBA|nr:hypothetical protein C1H46_031207 [Malus baccata]